MISAQIFYRNFSAFYLNHWFHTNMKKIVFSVFKLKLNSIANIQYITKLIKGMKVMQCVWGLWESRESSPRDICDFQIFTQLEIYWSWHTGVFNIHFGDNNSIFDSKWVHKSFTTHSLNFCIYIYYIQNTQIFNFLGTCICMKYELKTNKIFKGDVIHLIEMK